MNELSLSQLVGAGLSILSPLVTIFVLWKVGVIGKKNGNGNKGVSGVSDVLEAIQGLKSNDLHEIPEVLRSLQRIEIAINKGFERSEDKLDKLSEKIK